MDDRIKQLESENTRLKKVLREISRHETEIQKLLESVDDLLYTEEKTESAPVTEDDVKFLLKKYSRL